MRTVRESRSEAVCCIRRGTSQIGVRVEKGQARLQRLRVETAQRLRSLVTRLQEERIQLGPRHLEQECRTFGGRSTLCGTSGVRVSIECRERSACGRGFSSQPTEGIEAVAESVFTLRDRGVDDPDPTMRDSDDDAPLVRTQFAGVARGPPITVGGRFAADIGSDNRKGLVVEVAPNVVDATAVVLPPPHVVEPLELGFRLPAFNPVDSDDDEFDDAFPRVSGRVPVEAAVEAECFSACNSGRFAVLA